MSYEYERYDLVNILKKFSQSNDIQTMQEFRELLKSYLAYVEAVIQHVVTDFDMKSYGGDADSRQAVEMYSRTRQNYHNDAIRRTLLFQKTVLGKHGMIFYDKCIGKEKIQDFSPTERRELGDFIFSTISTCSTLTEKEIEKIGMNIEDINEQLFGDIITQKEKLERGYRVDITPKQSDIYDSLE